MFVRKRQSEYSDSRYPAQWVGMWQSNLIVAYCHRSVHRRCVATIPTSSSTVTTYGIQHINLCQVGQAFLNVGHHTAHYTMKPLRRITYKQSDKQPDHHHHRCLLQSILSPHASVRATRHTALSIELIVENLGFEDLSNRAQGVNVTTAVATVRARALANQ
jgi:hypothetical protein